MAGRKKKKYNYEDPLDNLRLLADEMASHENLRRCRALMGLVPVVLIDDSQSPVVAVLDAILRKIVEFADGSSQGVIVDHEGLENIRIAGALIGLSKPTESQIESLPANLQNKPLKNKMVRQEIAGRRRNPPVGHAWVRDHEDKILSVLLEAVYDIVGKLRDNPNLAVKLNIVSNLRPPLTVQLDEDEATPYVSRRHPEERFYQLRKDGARVIAIVGPPGMGKTRLAEELIKEEEKSGFVAVRLDTSSPENLQSSMYDALIDADHKADRRDTCALRRDFREFIESKSAPQYVLIDNLTDEQFLKGLISDATKSTIVVTARAQIASREAECHIEVRHLEPSEAIKLVISILPGTKDEHAMALADTLGGCPLVIEAACGMIKKDNRITILSFCANIRKNATILFDGTDDAGRPMLAAIYRRTLRGLEEADPQAYALLELIAFAADGSIETSVLYFCLAKAVSINPDNQDHALVILSRCIRELKRRYLVSTSTVSPTAVQMHSLTKTILAGLFGNRASVVGNFLWDGGLELCKKGLRKERTGQEVLKFFGDLYAIVGRHLSAVQHTIKGVADNLNDVSDGLVNVTVYMLDAIGANPEDFWLTVNPVGNGYVMMLSRVPEIARVRGGGTYEIFSFDVDELKKMTTSTGVLQVIPKRYLFNLNDRRIKFRAFVAGWTEHVTEDSE